MREFKTFIAQVEARGAREFSEYSTTEARVERESCQKMELVAGVMRNTKFDRSTLWAMF
jgi:hypothetical protein